MNDSDTMELLQEYNSDSDSDSTVQKPKTSLSKQSVRSVYMVTYSQVNKEEFPSRQVFARVLVESFQLNNNNK